MNSTAKEDKLQFKFLSGDINFRKYGGKWISNKLNNGDWDYFMVIESINMHNACGKEASFKYLMTLSAVSKGAAGPNNVLKALESEGILVVKGEDGDQQIIDALHTYGIAAPIWSGSGDQFNLLMEHAKQEANLVSLMFGFYMDRHVNRVGNTGWDAIEGKI